MNHHFQPPSLAKLLVRADHIHSLNLPTVNVSTTYRMSHSFTQIFKRTKEEPVEANLATAYKWASGKATCYSNRVFLLCISKLYQNPTFEGSDVHLMRLMVIKHESSPKRVN